MRDRPVDHPPFYKLASPDAALAILRNGTLRWSTPGTLNDPYDTQFDLYMPAQNEDLIDAALAKTYETFFQWGPIDPSNPLGRAFYPLRPLLRPMTFEEFKVQFAPTVREMLRRSDLLEELHDMIRGHAKPTKILCLTTNPSSIAMWSHYAAQHAGAMLRFQTAAFTDSPWSQARPVQYTETLPLLMTEAEWTDFASGRFHLDAGKVFDRLILSKAAEWSYESEWRIVAGNGRDSNAEYELIPFNSLELAEVVLGFRSSVEFQLEVRSLLESRYPHALLSVATKAPREYKMLTSLAERG